jgi:iron complex outermembrane receptor protein
MLHTAHIFFAWCFLAAAFVSAGHSQVETQEEQDSTKTYQIDEVVVTGTRTYRKIIDVPYSIERIDNTEFKYERKASVDNVLGSVPGLFFQNRYGNHDVRISIRGFGSRSNSGIRGVRILLDGMPESEPDGQTRIEAIDFQSIGSIEVVKGNSSSLYTNAPGGVINFINDLSFPGTFAMNFNEFGSFDSRSNGIKAGVKTDHYRFLFTYNYKQANGYRPHSNDNWHIVNTVLETRPGDNSQLRIYGYFVDGLIKLPGSLTKAEFDANPFAVDSTELNQDTKRISTKGRIGLEFTSTLGDDKQHEIQILGYGTMKYFERTASNYRIISRDGIGASGRYVYKTQLFGHNEEFSVGGDLFYQTGPVEDYDNIGGRKGDTPAPTVDESIGNTGFYFQNTFGLVKDRLDLLVTGRYDKIVFDNKYRSEEARSDVRRFEAFTPKAALNFKITPTVAVYSSYGLSFDSPAANELGNFRLSSKPASVLNPDLKPQKSNNFELGVKGNLLFPEMPVFDVVFFEATVFNSIIRNEIVPFEYRRRVYYRNAAKTNRTGIELGLTTDIAQRLRLKGAYTYSRFKYASYTARAIDDAGVITDRAFNGNFVPSVPKHNISLSLSYDHSFLEDVTGFVKTQVTHVSGLYVDDVNSDRTNGYTLLNANLGFDIVHGAFDVLVTAGANNIFDRTYVAFVNINSTSRRFYEAGEPRNYFAGINLGYKL